MEVSDKFHCPAALLPKKDFLYTLTGKLGWPLGCSEYSAGMENLCFSNTARYHSDSANPPIIPLSCQIIQPVCSKVKEVVK